MKNLKLIEEREILNKHFRIYGDFENPLFLAKDVAEWIEHRNITMMLKAIDEDEKIKIRPKQSLGLITNNNEYWFLTEDGLYEVLMQSRKPIAKQFKKMVKAILKEIRQTGSYNSYKPTKKLYYNGKPVMTIKMLANGLGVNYHTVYDAVRVLNQGELIEGLPLRKLKEDNKMQSLRYGQLIIINVHQAMELADYLGIDYMSTVWDYYSAEPEHYKLSLEEMNIAIQQAQLLERAAKQLTNSKDKEEVYKIVTRILCNIGLWDDYNDIDYDNSTPNGWNKGAKLQNNGYYVQKQLSLLV